MSSSPLDTAEVKPSFLSTYISRVKAFSRNARLYLIGVVVSGIAMGVQGLLFNFYVLSLGFNEAVIGNIVTVRSATALIAALPMGYLADRIGRRQAFMIGTISIAIANATMLLFPSVPVFLAMNILLGLGQSIASVAMGPFLMENSTEVERTYLFSFASGLNMLSVSIGQWIGGYLPTWMSEMLGSRPDSTMAYAASLAFVVGGGALSLIPNVMIRTPRTQGSERNVFAPLAYYKADPKGLSRLVLPGLIVSIGAGLIMPFMNVFFRNVHHQSDSAIGVLFAWASLAMGLGLLIAPSLAERYGKIQVVVVTQALSIPFLIILGFSGSLVPAIAAYYLRTMLMNMSNPVYSTFAMEQVKTEHRGMIASLMNMAHQFGWAFSPTISGFIQVRWGFKPAFLLTILLYSISIWLYYAFFWRQLRRKASAAVSPNPTADPTDMPAL